MQLEKEGNTKPHAAGSCVCDGNPLKSVSVFVLVCHCWVGLHIRADSSTNMSQSDSTCSSYLVGPLLTQ